MPIFNFKNLPKATVQRLLLSVALIALFVAGIFTGIIITEHRSGLDLSKFWQVYREIQKNYVGQVDKEKLTEGAISGLVSGLGDPFSSYLPPADKQSLQQELSGQFEGIGAELVSKDGLITVVAPLSDSPAEKAGLKAGDIIAKINGQSTENLTVDGAVQKIRGPKGTTVSISVIRQGQNDLVDLTITRDNIQVKSVNWKMIGEIGYLQITQFGDDTVSLTSQGVKELAAQSPKAVIIDLRNNPGGYLTAVTRVASNFLPPSVIVREKYRDGKQDELRSIELPQLPTTPLYILINGGSASASEILAGALQDYKRATLIGEKSFGKGSVQDVIDLPGKSALRITIAEWLTPNSRAINKVGITPDIEVKDAKTDSSDPVLDKALEQANK